MIFAADPIDPNDGRRELLGGGHWGGGGNAEMEYGRFSSDLEG